MLLFRAATQAPADVLTFLQEGNGAGTLDGDPFPASDFIITAVGDTDDRQSLANGWWIDHQSASIWIDGLGDLDFLSPTIHFVNNPLSIVGFSREQGIGLDLFDGPTDAEFGTWDMLSPIGPISGEGWLIQWIDDPQINTTGGILIFDTDYGVDATFTTVPEPATLAVFAVGGMYLMARRQRPRRI